MKTRLILAALLLAAPLAMAQEEVASFDPQPASYGTSSLTRHVVGAWDMEPLTAATTVSNSGAARFITSGSLFGNVNIPSGVTIERIGMRACDIATDARVRVQLGRCTTVGAACFAIGAVTTGALDSDAPGCGTFIVTLLSPFDYDNTQALLTYETTTGANANTKIESFFVDYRLRISPAPATPTFGDVSTSHPFYQFIEALAASGVTAGCGGGNFCPNDPLTRGQMAVFLARALGLHFAP